jgi:hypothetical protein
MCFKIGIVIEFILSADLSDMLTCMATKSLNILRHSVKTSRVMGDDSGYSEQTVFCTGISNTLGPIVEI